MLRNWFPQPRWKRHAAQSGYVYEYLFEGVHEDGRYQFVATSGPAIEVRITVHLDARIFDQWAAAHRPLTEIDRFGIAKMALLKAFDDRPDPAAMAAAVTPSLAEVSAICEELDL